MKELRYALRQFFGSPGFTVVAVVTLAMGIGANVAIFSVINGVLLNATGIPHADGLVALRARYKAMADLQNIPVSPPDFEDALESRKVFASAAAMLPASFNYREGGARPQRLVGAKVTSEWFEVFQQRPLLGRAFRAQDDVPGASNTVVLSYRFWHGQFGADPGIVGRKLELNGQPYEIIGVASADFDWPNGTELWSPLALPQKQYHDPNFRFNESLTGVARLQPHRTVEQANAVESAISEQVRSKIKFAQNAGWGLFVVPLREFISGSLRKPLGILLAAVMLVLMIACANIAGLQLARASDRHHENSIRIALGASRGRLMLQPLMESVLLAVFGIGVGIVLAIFATPSLLLLAPEAISRNIDARLNMGVLLFASVLSIVTVLLCGLAPALYISGSPFIASLREGGRAGTSSKTSQRLRSALVISEIAIAMFLLVGCGLLFRSLKVLEHLSTGFDPHGVMTATLSLPPELYNSDARQEAFFGAALESLRQTRGVTAASFVSDLPFNGPVGSSSFQIKGQVLAPNNPGPHGHIELISPDYFRVLAIPLLRGRAFTDGDRATTQPVAIVDETLARQYWQNREVLGEHISLDNGKTWAAIIGVVKHIKASSLEGEEGEGFYYLPVSQSPFAVMSVAVRASTAHPEYLFGSMQSAIAAIDPRQPLYDPKTLEQRLEDSLGSRRFVVVLLGLFSGLSVSLAAVGLYGVIAYLVRMRVREIGIRIALGARRSQIAAMVLRQGVLFSLVGCLLGLILTYSMGQALSSMLYAVSLYHFPTVLVSAALLVGLVLLACYLPARRAMNIDPNDALRQD